MIQKILSAVGKQKLERERVNRYRELMRAEAVIGGKVFGDLAEGHRREFFCLDETTWIWHEEWTDMIGRRNVRTTRYDVRPDSILKAQDGSGYQSVSKEEAQNLIRATKIYEERIRHDLYRVA